MKQLFVSYSRADKAAVDELVRRFPRLGYQGWVDAELHGGQLWWEVILRQIADCDAFVGIVSRESLNSEACQKELKWALDLGKPVLPIAVEAVEPIMQALLPRELATRQIVDWTEPGLEAAIELAGALNTLPPAPAPPEVLPERPEAPLSYLTDLGELVKSESLTHEQQRQIVTQLQSALHSADAEEQEGGQYLLDRFSRRDDLFADVDRRVGELSIAGQKSDASTDLGGSPTRTPNSSTTPTVVAATSDSSSTRTATVPVGNRPVGVAVDPTTHTVSVTNRGDGTVSVIDGATRTVTATVPVGKKPWGVAVDPGTRTVSVTNSADGTVSVIDGATRTVAATVPVGKNPWGVAVDPGTRTVSVTNSADGTVSVIESR